MNCKFFFLLICIIFSTKLSAQDFAITEISSRFIKDNDFDSIIRAKSLPLATSRNISPSTFDQRYPSVRQQFAELLRGLVTVGFSNSDRKYENLQANSSSYSKARLDYLSQVSNAVTKLLGMPVAFQPLFNSDNSDRILAFHSKRSE